MHHSISQRVVKSSRMACQRTLRGIVYLSWAFIMLGVTDSTGRRIFLVSERYNTKWPYRAFVLFSDVILDVFDSID